MGTDALHPLNDGDDSPKGQVKDDVFAVAVRMTRMPMVVADPNQQDCPIVYCNKAFCDLTGYAEEEILGRNCRFLQGRDTDRETVRRIAQALSVREDVHEELLNYRKDGTHFWNALQINAIVDDDGGLRYFFASQQNVTQRKEAALRQSQRMESLGALASGIAHEFNNLLTVVVGSIELAAARSVDEHQSEQLKRADWGARRAGELATQLLAMARKQAVDASAVDVNEAIRELEGTLAQVVASGVHMSLDLASTSLWAHLDPVQLDLVLLNLLRNSCDAMPQGGSVTVRTRALPAVEAVDILGIPDAVEISLGDTGEGMSPEVVARATEPFFTTKGRNKGTGLGLFLALSFAEQSAGRLLIETEQGSGTTVRIVVPRQQSS